MYVRRSPISIRKPSFLPLSSFPTFVIGNPACGVSDGAPLTTGGEEEMYTAAPPRFNLTGPLPD